MTAIVGLEYNGVVYMGSDSAGVSGKTITEREDPKVFVKDKFIFGFVGSFRVGQVLQYKFIIPKKHKSIKSDFEYMATAFVDAVRKCFSDNGVGEIDSFLVGYNGKLYCIYSDYQVEKTLFEYNAIGCGGAAALAAMYTIQIAVPHMNPNEKILLALNAAGRFNTSVCAPYKVIAL